MQGMKMELLIEVQPAKKTIEEFNGLMAFKNLKGPK